ncbi:hypothetical protein WN55_06406 [Dufourea novaeangliae]|uniref:Uncharacterized protein n=1 Tax=Dufourea novaeangliae TaxID=178035 RepID=A0A154P0I8_DUFNO|nr:hypothetical protein WN55_06406 [Dufourea novaeangliae]
MQYSDAICDARQFRIERFASCIQGKINPTVIFFHILISVFKSKVSSIRTYIVYPVPLKNGEGFVGVQKPGNVFYPSNVYGQRPGIRKNA